MRRIALSLALSCLFTVYASAQESDHGPRAGTVIGKGKVLAEILRGPGTSYRVYFLDENWTDAPTENVSVKAALQKSGAKKETPLSCAAFEQGFKCDVPASSQAEPGDKITFTRVMKNGAPIAFEYEVRPPAPTPTPWAAMPE